MNQYLAHTNPDDASAQPQRYSRRAVRYLHCEQPQTEHHVSQRCNADNPRIARIAGWQACEDEFRRQLMRPA